MLRGCDCLVSFEKKMEFPNMSWLSNTVGERRNSYICTVCSPILTCQIRTRSGHLVALQSLPSLWLTQDFCSPTAMGKSTQVRNAWDSMGRWLSKHFQTPQWQPTKRLGAEALRQQKLEDLPDTSSSWAFGDHWWEGKYFRWRIFGSIQQKFWMQCVLDPTMIRIGSARRQFGGGFWYVVYGVQVGTLQDSPKRLFFFFFLEWRWWEQWRKKPINNHQCIVLSYSFCLFFFWTENL